jgi:hypothetical protein
MLGGMATPPNGRDENKTRERLLQHSGQTDDRADETAERVEEAEARSQELPDDHVVKDGMATAHGSTPEQVRRADQLEARSYRQVQRTRQKATETHQRAVDDHDMAAEAHGRAAQLHDRQADLGWGNVEEHREQAHGHRDHEEADRAAADHLRDEYRADGSERPTPPAGPDTG